MFANCQYLVCAHLKGKHACVGMGVMVGYVCGGGGGGGRGGFYRLLL